MRITPLYFCLFKCSERKEKIMKKLLVMALVLCQASGVVLDGLKDDKSDKVSDKVERISVKPEARPSGVGNRGINDSEVDTPRLLRARSFLAYGRLLWLDCECRKCEATSRMVCDSCLR